MRIINFNEFSKQDLESDLPDVSAIINKVRAEGDKALRDYANLYDDLGDQTFEVSEEEIKQAFKNSEKAIISALTFAAEQISNFAKAQLDQLNSFEMINQYGRFGHKIIPVDRVGCYIPGGNYPLPSTVLMCAIPARIAGVREITVCCPKITSEVLTAAYIAGATRVLRLGGAHVIAALAYGTETIDPVDMIVGPGNKYVSSAKRMVFGKVGIDLIAGPSELLIIADSNANTTLVAADILAQAEHDIDARCYLLTESFDFAQQVINEIGNQIQNLSTKEIAVKSIQEGLVILCDTKENMVKISNLIAPEHVEIMHNEQAYFESELKHYGSLFLGSQSAEVFGDYCSGPNHTLPTGGTARFTGGLSVLNFIKIQTFQELNRDISKIIDTAAEIADCEGLSGHKFAADIRKL
ncbi:MAG: histidinol dehydrogenase [Candidatus Heimdallarchaeota archaeon]|nr:histidinol dehydrogenase [Candidatus Heimdallarchaeota archaeon]